MKNLITYYIGRRNENKDRHKVSFVKTPKIKNIADAAVAFAVVFIIIMIMYIKKQCAPFGNYSLANGDGDIQYLDFFSYFWDVLKGDNSIKYTFSNLLGDNSVGLYAYYLASPFNLLLIFFEKADIHSFYNLAIALKLAVSAVTFLVFLHGRFEQSFWIGKEVRLLGILLSAGYALSQYNLAQCDNIMWLDGVYMLPLILLGVYHVVQKNSGWRLSVFVGLSILFGWYTGGINCLFSAMWICFEIGLKMSREKYVSLLDAVKEASRYFIRYGICMLTGVLMSMLLFYPTIVAMKNSSTGTLEFARIMDISFIGRLPSIIQGYALGAGSSYGYVSLFCGSLAVIGCIGSFFVKGISKKEKTVIAAMCGCVAMLFYWNPFSTAFSLFAGVHGHWYRYSYVGIFMILFVASYFYLQLDFGNRGKIALKAGVWFAATLLLLDYLKPSQDMKLTYFTAASAMLTGCILFVCFLKKNIRKKERILCYSILAFFALFELTFQTKIQWNSKYLTNVAIYKDYVKNTETSIRQIQQWEEKNSIYRISQTSTRSFNRDFNSTANYNESLAYGYASVAGYTSAINGMQLDLLKRLGYRNEIDRITIVNTSILGVDSLLGVKYVLSEYPINGLAEAAEMRGDEEKKIYRNPFYLPIAFTYERTQGAEGGKDLNPFEYQNVLYKELGGVEEVIYKPLDFSVYQDSTENCLIYEISIPKERCAVYGNIPWNKTVDGVLDVNGVYKTNYAKWLAPSVFYIPVDINGESQTATLKFSASDYTGVNRGEEQFYALDLEALERITEKIRQRQIENMDVQNGLATFEVNANQETDLFISIPYDDGWTVMHNGKKIIPQLFADTLYSIPLCKGENRIEMRYQVPGLGLGTVGTLVGILLIVLMVLSEKRVCKKKAEALAESSSF